MIVSVGKHILVETFSERIERTCETPGLVTVTKKDGSSIGLNVADINTFVSALLRACSEPIEYKKTEVE